MGALVIGMSGIGVMMSGLVIYMNKMKDEILQSVDGLHESMGTIELRLDYNWPK